MSTPEKITGIGVSPGRVVAPVVRMPDPVGEPPSGRRLRPGQDPAPAAARIAAAAEQVRADLERAAAQADGQARELLEATATMAVDPTLLADAAERVTEEHLVPERAVWEAADAVAQQFLEIGGMVADRVRDITDVRDRLVAALTGRPAPGIPWRPEPFVLLAYDLSPADTAMLDPDQVHAIVTASGGPTSHTAILARARGIPAVVAARGILEAVRDGERVIVDGATGTVILRPTDEQAGAALAPRARVRSFDGAGRTADGHRVELLSNVGSEQEAAEALAAGAEGIGLFRTEFCFLDRDEPPTVEEQVAQYRPVLAKFSGKRVVVRTLDAGADKPLPFLADEPEPNPALGLRGLRTSWRHPEVLDDQLAAIARAAAAEAVDVWVMAPMVATVDEAADFVDRCARHGLTTAGIMIEVPSAALLAGPMLGHAHFASIGTNDLTQYTMAADRMLADVAALSDSWQPAVLHLVATACRGGEVQDRPVGICGEAAADPALAVVLVGLGVASLSMTPRALADVAAVLRATTRAECGRLAQLALSAPSAEDARARVRRELGAVLTTLGL